MNVILQTEHPTPWRYLDIGTVVDVNGNDVVAIPLMQDGSTNDALGEFIAAAPETHEELKKWRDQCSMRTVQADRLFRVCSNNGLREKADAVLLGMRLFPQSEIGWVIERGDSDPAEPKYWCAGHWDATRMIAWTSNHMAAIRFARREDAEAILHRLFPDIAVRICEHQWA